jgi:hypothetical protein
VTRGARAARAGLLTVLVALTLSGCSRVHANTGASPEAWAGALALAQTRAAAGRFASADTVLATYASLNPGTREALETVYWRALFRMDPSNPSGSLVGASSALDSYLSDPRPREHVSEATSIRRLIAQVEAVNRVAVSLGQSRDARGPEPVKPNEVPPNAVAEIRKLKDDLAKANAELERIRKRLAQPPPKQPDDR